MNGIRYRENCELISVTLTQIIINTELHMDLILSVILIVLVKSIK